MIISVCAERKPSLQKVLKRKKKNMNKYFY